jgi:hypothetical protein
MMPIRPNPVMDPQHWKFVSVIRYCVAVRVLSSEIDFDGRGAENFSKYIQFFMIKTKKNDMQML